ncbi:hypothetical protein ACF0H5_021272 [Mactra antiquata]
MYYSSIQHTCGVHQETVKIPQIFQLQISIYFPVLYTVRQREITQYVKVYYPVCHSFHIELALFSDNISSSKFQNLFSSSVYCQTNGFIQREIILYTEGPHVHW